MSETEATSEPVPDVIVCEVTPWYFKRMGLLIAMLVGMGAFFYYDGKWGYPKANKVPEIKEWFEKEVVGGYEAAKAQGTEAVNAWAEEARKKEWLISETLQEPRWDDYAAPHGWASDPKKYSADEIEQQFWWAWAMFILAAVVGTVLLLNRKKVFTGYLDHMVMPNGTKVNYADAYKIDKRKWDNKALAYVWHRPGGSGTSAKAVIDDLKYDRAGRVLDRLMSQFKGELIEKVKDEEEEPTANAEAQTSPEPADK